MNSKKKIYAKRIVKKAFEFKESDYDQAEYLVIVESPSKCGKIESYLGVNYKCIASKGHIRELVGLKSVDIKNNFNPTFTVIKEKADHVEQMRKIINLFKKENILLATDDDREGEGIAWHICQVFDLPIETTPRILFREITKPAILAAVQSPGLLDTNLVNAQQARQILDIIVGFTISPLLWKHVYHSKSNSLSAGRCQTPALRLVYDNEKERENSELEMRYKTTGKFFDRNLVFDLSHEFEETIKTEAFLINFGIFKSTFSMDQPRPIEKSPPKPFNTSRLLQIVSNSLHYSPKQTMQICQNLYQNGYITYMRTDSDKYSGVFLEQLDTFVLAEYGSKEYLGDLNNLENKDTSNPHEAIRVCSLQMRALPDGTDSKEATLYKLIWRNTVESCMSPAKYNSVLVKITAPNINDKSAYFTRILELPNFLGWKVVSSGNSGKEDPVVAEYLYLKIQETVAPNPVPFQKIDSTVVVRNKHSHYTEASLIKKLEDLGIGRPSTFATLVETIQDRGYVKCQDLKGDIRKCIEFSLKSPNTLAKVESEKTFGNEKNKLVIQPVGILCIEYLVKVFDKLFGYDYTKSMESVLDEIAHNKGGANWYDICKSCYTDIKTLSKTVENLGKQTFRIDESNDLVFQEFGPCIRSLESDGKAIYKPVKNGDKIDLEKVAAGKYLLSDLLAIPNENLGSYQDKPVLLKIGKYGPYLEWSDKKVGMKDIGIAVDKIRLEDAIKILEPTPKSEDKESKSILRVINLDISIRQGKFGPYIYYKTKKMKNPDFFNIKKFPCNYEDCDPGLVVEWVKHQIDKKQ